jgi:hypothetical protein
MNRYGDTGRLQSITGRMAASQEFAIDQEPLIRIIGLIQLAFNMVYALISLRFLLRLIGSNPDNAFASLVYAVSTPFVRIFRGLTPSPSYQGIVIEIYALIALVVYALLGWLFVKLMWILFARMR